ncbi:hypothetical protein R3P38DRAFT_3295911 [Favolaschia claudopus]|uniref:Uncharacterized protein n=1 Tax=Favolaschia claudopus TaxID=2862362 RepID=A0AAV9Z9X1_9AGAR
MRSICHQNVGTWAAFPALYSLSITITGFEGVVRHDSLDSDLQANNMLALFKSASDNLKELKISGDLISSTFPTVTWPRLRSFTVTEHTPTPYISVPELTYNMPALRNLSILYTADLTRNEASGDLFPPFCLGVEGGQLLSDRSPFLESVTLSNQEPMDPILAQLPPTLPSLHLRAMADGYHPIDGSPWNLRRSPLTNSTAPRTLEKVSHLTSLTELSLSLKDFVQPALIKRIVAVFPQLQVLELSHASFINAHGRQDVCDPALLESLQLFPCLQHLRIALDFDDWDYDPWGPQRRAARWLLGGIPSLRTVCLSWQQFWYEFGFDVVVWHEWDRGLFFRPPTPPLPEPPPFEDIEPVEIRQR